MPSEIENQLAALNAEYEQLTATRPGMVLLSKSTRDRKGGLQTLDFASLAATQARRNEWEKTPAAIASKTRRDELRKRIEALERRQLDESTAAAYAAQATPRLLSAGVTKKSLEALQKPKSTPSLERARTWWPSDSWALTMLGGVGTGKTTAAAWLAQQCVTAGTGRDWLVWIRCSEASRRSLFGDDAEKQARHARHCTLLVLDDIGTEFNGDGWRNWLSDVLDDRYAHGRKTVLTSNLAKEDFAVRLGERLVDRLRENGQAVGTGTESMRRSA